ncbi:hypothetical protein QUF80_04245 [Desulfococcaceae bacterium HSG8]|nr:hypothetical protein [Desulfococcaceae bacterium HSG8]
MKILIRIAGCLVILGAAGCLNPVHHRQAVVKEPTNLDGDLLQALEDGQKAIARKPLKPDADIQSLKTAQELFQKGNFEAAAEIFESLDQESRSVKIRRAALYGLACAKLILSQKSDEFEDGLHLWKTWNMLIPNRLNPGDPRMLTPLLYNGAYQKLLEIEEKFPSDTDMEALKSGQEAFQKKIFKEATEIFERMTREAGTEEMRRIALYGLACARLIMARTPAMFSKAIQLWKNWSEIAPASLVTEDPRMLTPLLHRKKRICEKDIKAKAKEIRRLRYKLEKLKKENKLLEHQIEALETIHQDIREKKRGIQFP